ncbi:MAG: asparagine synthase (glutamine-hydrolyzing) [Alphaproteobacteria bacterium]
MCGIAGFFTPENIGNHEGHSLTKAMTDTLTHRGPDADGVWGDGDNGIFLGHRRLSILDLSKAGAQPMTSQNGRYVASYNGEIYNTNQLLNALRYVKSDISFKGHSDTEIMLEGFALLGLEKTLSIIKGMFAIALWDKQEKTLTLVRDHVGKKPFYVGWVGDKIAFASELKAFIALNGCRPEIDMDAMAAYRYFGFIPAPRSIYKNIFKLRPAHYIVLQKDDLSSSDLASKMKPYWVLKKGKEDDSAGSRLKEVLSSAVSGRMMSDVPLGAFLSGGIDSSLVTALMQEQSDTPVKTYSIGFDDGAFDESKHAEKVAAHLKTDHTTYMVTARETLDVIPNLPRIYDEPFADYSQIPTTVLCAQARKDTVVALSGDGGDEVFCGYKRYFMLKRLLDKTSSIPAPIRKALALCLNAAPQNIYNLVGGNGKRMHSIAGFLQEAGFDKSVLRTLSIQPGLDLPDGLNLGQSEGLSDLERMMMIDTHLYLPDDILVKVDRASMFSSLEVRSPLLDKDVIELAWTMNIKDKVFDERGRGKRPLYDLLCDYVPREIIDRPKQGFTPPVADWLRSDLKDWGHDLIHTDTPLFEQKDIQEMWRAFQSGRIDNHSALWGVLMAQSWYLDS